MTSAAALPVEPTVDDLLEHQDQVISRVQARRAGMTEDGWQWRLDTGRWTSLLPGVAVAHSGDATDRQRAWAAVLYGGDDVFLSADAALVQHGMRLPAPREIHVATSRRIRRQRFRDESPALVVPHQLLALERWQHPARRPRALRAPPAALHAAAWAPSERAGEWRLAAAVQQRVVRVSDLRAALAQMPQVPRRALLAEVLDDVEFGAHAASELDFVRFLRRHHLPLPDRLQRPVRVGKLRYLDAWWERQRVNAEMDGAHHRMVGTWDDDALRANDVVLVERHDRILLLRFTRANLRHDGDRVAAQLRDALL
jgi:very-short-patch-repair endonuclease